MHGARPCSATAQGRAFVARFSMPRAIVHGAARKKAANQAQAANMRAGYTGDPILEAAVARYVSGDITSEEMR